MSSYASVEYREVYPGVILVYYGKQRQLEYDLVIAPGADPSIIKLAFEGAQRLRLDAGGDLLLKTAGGEVRQHKPMMYQEVDGVRKSIEGHYVLKGRRQIGFEITEYDPSRQLVIDPVLSYSTYLGGTGADGADGIAVDSSGNVYVTGTTYSPASLGGEFPRVNAYQTVRRGNYDAFVTKISPSGTLLYSTYLGGDHLDNGYDIAVDFTGNAYVTGLTRVVGFPGHECVSKCKARR